jgi:hypothetical protein
MLKQLRDSVKHHVSHVSQGPSVNIRILNNQPRMVPRTPPLPRPPLVEVLVDQGEHDQRDEIFDLIKAGNEKTANYTEEDSLYSMFRSMGANGAGEARGQLIARACINHCKLYTNMSGTPMHDLNDLRQRRAFTDLATSVGFDVCERAGLQFPWLNNDGLFVMITDILDMQARRN